MRVALLSMLLVVPAFCAEPPSAMFSSFNDWIGADPKGVRICADGRLRLAPALRRAAQIPEGVIWAAVPDGSGGAYLSAGNEGRLFHFTGGQVKPFTQVKGGIVFAMVRLGADLIVAPSGEGKLLKVTPSGDVKPFADIETRLVWALGLQGGELVVAGGGEKGAALLLAREGSSRKLAELPEESSFTCLAPDGRGGWYLGTHGRGLLLRYTGVQAGDRLETLYATGFEEVKSIVVHEDDIYLGLSNGLGQRFAGGTLERREAYLAEPGNAAKGAVVRFGKSRTPETLWQSAQAQVFSMQAWKSNGQLLIGTGNRSRIFGIPLSEKQRVQEPFSVIQDPGTAQVTAFLPLGPEMTVVASNPGELHIMSESLATEGYLESRVLKGMPMADWGRAYMEAQTSSGTSVEIQCRCGFTETPDSTWTAWTPPLKSGERPLLPPSRCAQFRLKLSSPRGGTTPVVENVRLHWANRNLAPLWDQVEVLPPGVVVARNAPPDDIGIERIPLETQKLIPALGFAGGEKRSFRRGAQAFLFKATDPNGDALQYRIRLLAKTGSPIELEKAWKDRFFTFDTLLVPDGAYCLEVAASDALSQPFNLAMTSFWTTGPFLVDHSSPKIQELSALREGDAVRVKFLAKDEASNIKEATVSLDGDRWLQLAPEDRIFDMQEERFDVLIPADYSRGDRVMVRVADQCNNECSTSVLLWEARNK